MTGGKGEFDRALGSCGAAASTVKACARRSCREWPSDPIMAASGTGIASFTSYPSITTDACGKLRAAALPRWLPCSVLAFVPGVQSRRNAPPGPKLHNGRSSSCITIRPAKAPVFSAAAFTPLSSGNERDAAAGNSFGGGRGSRETTPGRYRSLEGRMDQAVEAEAANSAASSSVTVPSIAASRS